MTKAANTTTISAGFASTDTLNANFSAVNTALENTLSRDGSTPNNMEADLDLNSNDLINVDTIHTTHLKVGGVSFIPDDAATVPEWKGAWVTLMSYVPNDLVRQSGSTYICLQSHVAGVFATDLAALKWELFAQQGAAGAGTGDMLAANNLSDVANVTSARANLGITAANLGLLPTALTSANNLDSIADGDFYWDTSVPTNSPLSSQSMTLTQVTTSGGTKIQVASGATTFRSFQREYISAAWSAWYERPMFTGTPVAGDTLYSNGTTWPRLAKGTALQVKRMNSGATAPEWANGITYSGTPSTGTIAYYNAGWQLLDPGTAGQYLRTNGAAAPSWATPATASRTLINTKATTSGTTVTFSGLSLSGYSVIEFVFDGVSGVGATAALTIDTGNGAVTISAARSAGSQVHFGIFRIDVATGAGSGAIAAHSPTSPYAVTVDATNCSFSHGGSISGVTSITIGNTISNFDAGQIKLYGIT